MSLLINNNGSSGLQGLAKLLQYSNPAALAPSANTNVQKPDWQSMQSHASLSQTSSSQSGSGLNVTYSYTHMIKTDLSLVGGSVTSMATPPDGSQAVSTVSSGYDLSVYDSGNS